MFKVANKKKKDVLVAVSPSKMEAFEKFKEAAELILSALPYRKMTEKALLRTPERFAKMMMEQLEGEFVTNEEIKQLYDVCFDYEDEVFTDWVIVKDISCFSHCEHHLALMYNMKVSIGYKPETKILGLSKFARIVDLVSKRLQTQEVMGRQILEILMSIMGEETPICVHISGEHSCMTARGIKKPGSVTTTVHSSGVVTTEDLQLFLMRLENNK